MKKQRTHIEHVIESIDWVLSLVDDDKMKLNPDEFFYNIGTLTATYHIHRIKDQRESLQLIKKLIKQKK
tara:strand:- start:689 stop:895 length:207 start_codon:yes stop_codon:yes gene_type:complete